MLHLADKDYSIIRKIDKLGIITTVAGTTYGYSGDGGPAISAKVQPWDVELDSIGNIYIADGSNNVVRKIVANPVGLSENEKKQNMFLFPNPATNILQISNDNNEFKNSIIEVINYLSQTVLKQVYSNSIDVSKLPSGIYTLKINASGKESLYSKFIKE
jgi:hypothetical protein